MDQREHLSHVIDGLERLLDELKRQFGIVHDAHGEISAMRFTEATTEVLERMRKTKAGDITTRVIPTGGQPRTSRM